MRNTEIDANDPLLSDSEFYKLMGIDGEDTEDDEISPQAEQNLSPNPTSALNKTSLNIWIPVAVTAMLAVFLLMV
ncbi:MAG: hypothetical protein R3240_13795 [Gammaproteobacteria bacterium]|nr:hypothetical protein [Gammaproteobacteria bacterium]